jgi:pilus assembly protein CpaF
MNFDYRDAFLKITEEASLDEKSQQSAGDWVQDLKPQRSFTDKVSELIQISPHADRLQNEVFGDGPLKHLLEDEEVTEVMINDFETIYYEKSGQLFQLEDQFLSDWSFQRFIHRLLESSQHKLDLETPFASFAWKKFRVHLSHPPISKNSHLLSLRRIQVEKKFTLQTLQELGSCTEEQRICLENGIRNLKNILVVGGTGTGKTTVLGALLKQIEINERVVVLEDTDEVSLPNRASVKLLTRNQSPSLAEFNLGDLLKEALRMRPDRLVVGEVRGGEAKDLLMSLSTGHQGSFATLHAATAQEALLRLEMLIQMGAPHWSVDSIRKLISLTVNWVVVVDRFNKSRRIEGVYEITSLESIGFLTHKIC